jgi:4-hydroxy-tetrahydrodipicolinate reductase
LGAGLRVTVRLAEASPLTGGLILDLLHVEGANLATPRSAKDKSGGRKSGGRKSSAAAVKEHTLCAVNKSISVIVGSSGLTADDFAEIEKLALSKNVGVIACGNFSITAALAKHFALVAAEYLPSWEILDYAGSAKMDAPSGTARELAECLEAVRQNKLGREIKDVVGDSAARGAQIKGTPVHSLRLPGYVLSFETIFGLPEERLTVRHDAGTSALPYVDGTLLALRKVGAVKGLIRGLDQLMFGKS